MTSAIGAPDPFATRAHAADWLELMALKAAPTPYRSAEYVGALTLALDKPDGNKRLEDRGEDEEILDNVFDNLIEGATEEIRWRRSILGDLYPFELRRRARSWTVTYNRAGDAPTRLSQDVYTTCLLMSSTRHGRLDGLPEDAKSVKTVSDAFQAAVYLVAPALLGGASFWIGFPRPEGDDYRPALERLFTEIGVGKVSATPPVTQPKNKDGGIDIVTWRTFPDGRSNILLSYGQVATGKYWRHKSVENKIKSYYFKWLDVRPTTNFIPAMYIPHVMHEEISATATSTYEEVAQEDAHDLEGLVGLVVDRLRMTALVPEAFRIRKIGHDRGAPFLRQLRTWQVRVTELLRHPE